MSSPVAVSSDEDREVLSQLVQSLSMTILHHQALGLSAVQIGIPVRMFAMRAQCSDPSSASNLKFVINPSVVSYSTVEPPTRASEGCLSFEGVSLQIERPRSIEVTYLGLDGEPVLEVLNGLDARCFLHELDHLDGILFTDRVSPLERSRAIKRTSKVRKRKSYGVQNYMRSLQLNI